MEGEESMDNVVPYLTKVHSMAEELEHDLELVSTAHQREKELEDERNGIREEVFGPSDTVHLRTHSGERPFKCTYCDKCFVSRNLRIAHEKVHFKIVEGADLLLMEEEYYGLPSFLPNDQVCATEEMVQAFMCPIPRCGYVSTDLLEVEAHLDLNHAHQMIITEKDWQRCTDEGADFVCEDKHRNGRRTSLLNIGEEVTVISQESFNDSSFIPSQPSEELLFVRRKSKDKRSIDNSVTSRSEEALTPDQFVTTSASSSNELPSVLFGQRNLSNESEEDGDGPSTSVCLLIDLHPPSRGRVAKGSYSNLEEVAIDAEFVEMVGPIRNSSIKDKVDIRPARNLDWIIEAVARGMDIDSASPHHRRKPTTWLCKVCDRIIKYPSRIEAHRRMHAGEKPYKCEICGMAFSQRTPMRLHVRRHLDQKPYVCMIDGCGQRFVSGSILNCHQKEKHFNKTRRYFCLKGCGSTFNTAQARHRHETMCDFNGNTAQFVQEEEEQYGHDGDEGDDESGMIEEVPFLGEEEPNLSDHSIPDPDQLMDVNEENYV